MTRKPPAYLQGNVDAWQVQAEAYIPAAERAWASAEPYWGVWSIPDTGLNLLPADLSGMSCIELGCGTAYVSAWMCRRGGEVVAIDPTPNQLATARRLRSQYHLPITITEGFAESVPYPDASFDFAFSEYGAALWSDPYQWIPEAARLLKPGGQLVFLSNSALMNLCAPEDENELLQPQLLRPYFGMHTQLWDDAPGQTEFHLNHGDWIKLLREHRFVIERLVELQPPLDATSRYPWANLDWARQWPTEEAWVVRKEMSSKAAD
jgi:SAM-dependent methyltransferase